MAGLLNDRLVAVVTGVSQGPVIEAHDAKELIDSEARYGLGVKDRFGFGKALFKRIMQRHGARSNDALSCQSEPDRPVAWPFVNQPGLPE
jgi:hypothetical protein